MPVRVDLSRRLEAELEVVRVRALLSLITGARVLVLNLAVPLYHVSIALEVRDADAEVVELISELCCEAINERTIRCGHIALCHCLGNHLRHLITRDVAVAAERAVAVALDNAVSSELRYSVVCPVVTGHIGERVRSCERGGCCADNECRCECGYECLLHEKLLLQ